MRASSKGITEGTGTANHRSNPSRHGRDRVTVTFIQPAEPREDRMRLSPRFDPTVFASAGVGDDPSERLLRHGPETVANARTGTPGSAGSRFQAPSAWREHGDPTRKARASPADRAPDAEAVCGNHLGGKPIEPGQSTGHIGHRKSTPFGPSRCLRHSCQQAAPRPVSLRVAGVTPEGRPTRRRPWAYFSPDREIRRS